MFHTASKIFWYVADPLALITILAVLTAVLAFTGRRRLMRLTGTLTAGALILCCFTTLGTVLLASLEQTWQRPDAPQSIHGIIVLGGGLDRPSDAPEERYELDEAADRFVEAARLANLYPEARIMVTGGVGGLTGGGVGDAIASQAFFEGLGISAERLILESEAKNTYQNALFTAGLINTANETWLLVTSAFHMPRAAAVFEAQNISVIPWPVDYRVEPNPGFRLDIADPLGNLSAVSIALRERIGMLAYRLTGRM